MNKLSLVPAFAVLWTACVDQPLLDQGMGGESGSTGSGGSNSSGGSNGSGGSSTSSAGKNTGGGNVLPPLGGSGNSSAGKGGDGAGGMTAGAGGAGGTAGSSGSGGSGGSGGGYPATTTCAEYAAKFGTFGFYATANRMVQESFTIEAWINTSATSLTGTNFYDGNGLIYADVSGDNNDFGVSILNNKLAFGTGNPETTVVSATSVNTGMWVHVAATRNASTGALVVLVDGQSDGTGTSTNLAALNASTTITIGGNSIDGRYFDGLIDEVRIWNVVRTPAQIQATMNAKLAGNETGLVAYWSFDDAGAATQPDASPSNADATVNGSPGYVDSLAPVCD
jgi:hypothetical protein